jgi:O-antigen/teichoic acid export membrane protein
MREMARGKSDGPELLGQAFVGKLLIGAVILFTIFILAIVLAYQKDVLLSIMIYGVSMLLISFSNTFRSIFIALERAEYEALLLILSRLLLLGGIILCVLLNIKIPGVMVSHLVAGLITLWLGSYLCKKLFFSPVWAIDFKKVKDLFREAIPFAIGAIMGEIFFNIDTVMISKMVGLESVGYYNAAYKLSFSGVLLANTVTLAAYPHFSKQWLEDRESVFRVFEKVFKILTVSSIAFSLPATLLSADIIGFVFGPEYNQSIRLFQILVWSLPGLFLMHLTGRTLDAIGEQRFSAKTMSFCVLMNIILNLILILKFGAIGAAIAMVFTSFVVVMIHMYRLRRRMEFPKMRIPIAKISICLIGLLATILLLKGLNWWVAVTVGFAVYCGMLIGLKVLEKEDIVLLTRRST